MGKCQVAKFVRSLSDEDALKIRDKGLFVPDRGCSLKVGRTTLLSNVVFDGEAYTLCPKHSDWVKGLKKELR